MEYVIVQGQTTIELEETVVQFAGEGWEPQGGVVIVPRFPEFCWAQAMIRRAPAKPEAKEQEYFEG